MFDWLGLLLQGVYYYGHIIGVNNFNFDWRTGRVFTTTWTTLYAIVSNAIIVMLTGLTIFYVKPSSRGSMIQDYVISTGIVLRISAVLGTLLDRWRYKSQLKIVARNTLRLCLASPYLIRMSRWRIFFKFGIGVVVNISQMFALWGIMARVDTMVSLELATEFWLWTILHLSLAQHYMVMLCVRAQYHLLKMELRQVVYDSMDLSYNPPRIGAFMTRCCFLADQLENIAKLQSHLQSIVTQLYAAFGVQELMMYIVYYVNTVVHAYLTYSGVRLGRKNLTYTLRDFIIGNIWTFSFYMDAILNLFIALHVQDDNNDLICLLEERTLFASGLDARLEQTFESFQLQLIRNPFQMDVLKLFPVTRSSTWAMFGSVVLNSIYLVQYDLESLGKE